MPKRRRRRRSVRGKSLPSSSREHPARFCTAAGPFARPVIVDAFVQRTKQRKDASTCCIVQNCHAGKPSLSQNSDHHGLGRKLLDSSCVASFVSESGNNGVPSCHDAHVVSLPCQQTYEPYSQHAVCQRVGHSPCVNRLETNLASKSSPLRD